MEDNLKKPQKIPDHLPRSLVKALPAPEYFLLAIPRLLCRGTRSITRQFAIHTRNTPALIEGD